MGGVVVDVVPISQACILRTMIFAWFSYRTRLALEVGVAMVRWREYHGDDWKHPLYFFRVPTYLHVGKRYKDLRKACGGGGALVICHLCLILCRI